MAATTATRMNAAGPAPRKLPLLLAMAGLCLCLSSCCSFHGAAAQVQCDRRRAGRLAAADCANAVRYLGEDSYALRPGFYMQEVYGTCKARVTNRGRHVLKVFRDAVTLEFADIMDECVKLNGHPGAILLGSNAVYSLTPASPNNIKSTAAMAMEDQQQQQEQQQPHN